MKNKRIVILVACLVVAFGCLGYVGIRSFVKNVYDSKGCEWANIDNIEIRAQINIPKIHDSECAFDSVSKTKKVLFVLDKSVDLEAYHTENKLQKVTETEKLTAFNLKPEALANTDHLYFRENKTEWESYKILLDASSGKLWIELQYLD